MQGMRNGQFVRIIKLISKTDSPGNRCQLNISVFMNSPRNIKRSRFTLNRSTQS